ncbi:MAG TPA: hypothetical protein VI011_14470 [Asanoa sp.]|jgi:cell division septum initiation protein DivIVA
MSRDDDLLATLGGGDSRFDLRLGRSYPREQVDRYVRELESELERLEAERRFACSQANLTVAQLEQLQLKVVDLERTARLWERPSFRHLGPVAGQILTLAEEEARTIRESAAAEAAERRAEAQRILQDAHSQAQRLVEHARATATTGVRDFEITLAARRRHEVRADEERRAAVDADLARAQARIARIDAEADEQLESSRQEARRIIETARAQAQRSAAETREWAESARAAVQVDLSRSRDAADQELAERRAEAERELAAMRAVTVRDCATARVRIVRWAQEKRAQVQRQVTQAEERLAAQLSDGERQIGEGLQQLATARLDAVDAHHRDPTAADGEPAAARPSLAPAEAGQADHRQRPHRTTRQR